MVDASSKPYVTFADYLEAEQSSDVKHEWFNGSVYAMSRGTPDHARLSASVIMLLGSALPRGCVIYTSDLMLYVEAVKLSTYADASVVCGPLETITVKRNGRSLGEGATNRAGPGCRYAERLAGAVGKRADVDVIAHLSPPIGTTALSEHGIELGLEGDDDQHVDRRKLHLAQRATRRGHVGIIGCPDGPIKPCVSQLSRLQTTSKLLHDLPKQRFAGAVEDTIINIGNGDRCRQRRELEAITVPIRSDAPFATSSAIDLYTPLILGH